MLDLARLSLPTEKKAPYISQQLRQIIDTLSTDSVVAFNILIQQFLWIEIRAIDR